MEVLVIEDDPTAQTLIKLILQNQEHDVILAQNAANGTKLASGNTHDMIILDLGLPDGDGYDVCKQLREDGIATPILVLSAEHETDIKVKCLEIGADDYLTKPFDNSELTARIDAIMRRSNGHENEGTLECGELKMDLISRECTVNGTPVDLTNNEYNLLVYLVKRKNKIVSLEEIAENVWDIHFDTQTNYINVYISYLRKKIRAHSEHDYISTVRKKGFVINCPEDEE
jgi:DNA-binding response OmpR family regulator